MDSEPISIVKKRRVQRGRRSRFGCRNCKLRKLKCDETKPQCMKCQTYGVLCNFEPNVLDLQPLSEQKTKKQITQQSIQPSPRSTIGNCIWAADGTTFSMLDVYDHDLFTRFRLRTLHSLGGPEMVDIYEKHMLALSFTYPFMLHGTLAVTAVHDRYLGLTRPDRRSLREAYHWSQCTALFNKWLDQPIKEEHKDPIWATAGTLGILAFASINTCCLEKRWPLVPSDTADLQWLQLGAGKMRLWQLVNPLREKSVFTTMADTFVEIRQTLPMEGIDGVRAELLQLCMLDESSTAYNNPYFTVAHALSELLAVPKGEATLGKAIMASNQMRGEFRDLLEGKDPKALTLLYLWYTRARESRWWIDLRARARELFKAFYIK
ncbi:C6 finger domain protein [Fusarium beomiforme]|uniref:C6 finger domain protein n=1 Tax=Fusarium beomiforme TaxID=44412 RepID=A0A9P5ASE4_9HYPO|nr:C6 finger domain protein [Fusarium beomiforme]